MRFAMLASGVLLALLIAEGGVRLTAGMTLSERGQTYSPDFGWRMLPSIRKFNFFWGRVEPATTNSHGLGPTMDFSNRP